MTWQQGVVTSIWIHLAGALNPPLVDQQGSGNFLGFLNFQYLPL